MRRLPMIHGFLLVLMCAAGCTGSSGAPELIPVSGTVMYKGAPVEGATVNFHHDKAPRLSSGVTDKDGKFVLTMLESGDGAMPGTNIVTVTKGAAPAAAPATSNAAPSPEDLAKKMAEFKAANDPKKKKDAAGELPAKYGAQTTTPLKEEISATNNKVVLQLAD